MRKLLLLFGLLLGLGPAQAADNALIVTPGAGVTMRTIDVGSLVQAGTSVPVGVNGVSAWGTAGTANANILTVQGIASMTPLLVTATQSGTWNVNATQTGTWTVQPGNTANTTAWLVTGTGGIFPSSQSGNWTMRNVGNAGAILDFAGQNASSPANAFLMGGQFNTAPTTITTGNASPLQLDNAGNLLVNVKAGGAAGGTSSNFGSAFPTPGTAIGAKNGANMVNLTADGSGNLNVAVASATGLAQASTTSGQTGSMVMGAVTTNPPAYSNGQTNPVSLDVAGNTRVIANLGTIGGATPKLLNALSNTATTVKASAGQLFELYCYNPNATVAYIQVYDVSGAVTVGTTPAALSYGIPATSSAGRVLSVVGTQFANAIKVAATTAAANGTAPGTAVDCNASFN